MILTGENQNAQKKKTCPSVTMYVTIPIWICLGLNLNLCGDSPTVYSLSNCIHKV
jgi:hypothetical protein